MLDAPKDLKFAKTHEWAKVDGESVVVGITDFAQSQLSDVTYVELPEVGDHLAANDESGVIESVKAASDIYAPVGGTVVAVNTELLSAPELINGEPYAGGWLYKLKPDDLAELDALMSAEQYEESLPEEDHDEG